MLLFLFVLSQLCNGGSVTELVKGLLRCGQRLDEAVISYILYGALLVREFLRLGCWQRGHFVGGLDPHCRVTVGKLHTTGRCGKMG